MSTPDEELVAQPGLLESLKSSIADRSHFIAGRPERKRIMKTKVIEHEWVTFDQEDGEKDTSYLIAVKAPASQSESKNGDIGTAFDYGWQIDQTDLRIYSATEAREYIKLLEKVIEAEESGD